MQEASPEALKHQHRRAVLAAAALLVLYMLLARAVEIVSRVSLESFGWLFVSLKQHSFVQVGFLVLAGYWAATLRQDGAEVWQVSPAKIFARLFYGIWAPFVIALIFLWGCLFWANQGFQILGPAAVQNNQALLQGAFPASSWGPRLVLLHPLQPHSLVGPVSHLGIVGLAFWGGIFLATLGRLCYGRFGWGPTLLLITFPLLVLLPHFQSLPLILPWGPLCLAAGWSAAQYTWKLRHRASAVGSDSRFRISTKDWAWLTLFLGALLLLALQTLGDPSSQPDSTRWPADLLFGAFFGSAMVTLGGSPRLMAWFQGPALAAIGTCAYAIFLTHQIPSYLLSYFYPTWLDPWTDPRFHTTYPLVLISLGLSLGALFHLCVVIPLRWLRPRILGF